LFSEAIKKTEFNCKEKCEIKAQEIDLKAITRLLGESGLISLKGNTAVNLESPVLISATASSTVLTSDVVPLLINSTAIVGPTPDGTVSTNPFPVTFAPPPSISSTSNNEATFEYIKNIALAIGAILAHQIMMFVTTNRPSGNSSNGSGFPAFFRNDVAIGPLPIPNILGFSFGLSASVVSSFISSISPGSSLGSSSPGTSPNAGGFGGDGGGGGSSERGPTEFLEDMPRGFLWKPVSESTGKLVVLLPNNIRGGRVTVIKPDNTRVSGNMTIIANGGREHFRFSEPGSAFPPGSRVETSAGNFTIPESGGGVRYEGTK
jgi:hypothetical protein